MKNKKALKLIKEILVLANESQEKQNRKIPENNKDVIYHEGRFIGMIPDYKKVSPNLDNVILANKKNDSFSCLWDKIKTEKSVVEKAQVSLLNPKEISFVDDKGNIIKAKTTKIEYLGNGVYELNVKGS
jgi:hypothetical protein